MTHTKHRIGKRPALLRIQLWFVLAAMLLAACGQQQTATLPAASPSAAPQLSPSTPPAVKVKAVTTMSIIADMIKQVGGERVEAVNIIPVGAGPEDYQPTPQDSSVIAAADIVFFNGTGLEDWLTGLFDSAGNSKQQRIALSEGLEAVDVGSEDFKQDNPHFWLDPIYGIEYVKKIRDGLTQVDPAGKVAYMQNADAYIAKLEATDKELATYAATIPEANRKMVTNHDAFPYFAKRYGFTIVGNILGSPESEPSAGDLAQLVDKIKAEQVKAIFSEAQFSPKLAQVLADEAGITIVAELYTDSLSDDASAGTYIDMLIYDMRTVVDALK